MSDVALFAEERARTKARHRRWRRRARGCAVAMAALIAGLAVFAGLALLVVYWIDASAFARATEQARADGAPLTLEEIKALYVVGPEHGEATKRWQTVLEEKLGAARSAKDGEGVPFIDARRSDEGEGPPLRDARGMIMGEDLRIGAEYVESFREPIEAAHEARRAGGVARFPAAFEVGLSANLSHLGPLQRLAALIRLDMEVRLARGETDEAFEDLLTLLAIVDILAEEPYSVSHYHRFMIQGVARKGLERLLDGGGLNDEQLRRIDEAFARTKALESFRRSLVGERWIFVTLFEKDDENPSNMYDAWQIAEPWFKGSDFAKGLEWYGKLDKASESSLREAAAEYTTIQAEIATLAGDPTSASTYPLTLVYFPSMTYSLPIHQKGESCEAVARTAIACERYRLVEGSLPQKLDDLVPKYLPALPVDAYDGKPLRYVIDAKGAKVYSVGPDLVDNGGGVPTGSGAAAFASPDDVIFLNAPEPSP